MAKYEHITKFGIGGYDESKPNNNIIEEVDTRTVENTRAFKADMLAFDNKNYIEDNIGRVRLDNIRIGMTATPAEQAILDGANQHYQNKISEVNTIAGVDDKATIEAIEQIQWEL